MRTEAVVNPTSAAVKAHIIASLSRYWPLKVGLIESLPIPPLVFPVYPAQPAAPLLKAIPLPEWAQDVGVEGELLVPVESTSDGAAFDWQRVDWWLAAFLMLESWHERAWEQAHGPIHSYSLRLQGWDERLWAHAWVNRIALFLRRWAARNAGGDDKTLFGPLPQAELVLTHDVDAVHKTWSIRFKQTAFHAFNSIRYLLRGQFLQAAGLAGKALRFFFTQESYWQFDRLMELEVSAGLRSHFNFFAGGKPRSIRQWLFNPAYDLHESHIREVLHKLLRGGWAIGLHQGFDSWRDAECMQAEKRLLEEIALTKINSCRQHWLRFSWSDTWAAQEAAGLELDTTLMFNDRPGLRSAAALCWQPWDDKAGGARQLQVLPTVVMDSHFYDYRLEQDGQRASEMRRWISEVRAVGGQAAVLWHPHTLARDYGWGQGNLELLELLKNNNLISGPSLVAGQQVIG